MQGQRQKKLAERELREAKIEAERRMQDIEEARLAAERRKDILERAKTKQYYQTDRVKTFHVSHLNVHHYPGDVHSLISTNLKHDR